MSLQIERLYERLHARFPASETAPSPEAADADGQATGEEEKTEAPLAPCRRVEHARTGRDIDLDLDPHQLAEAARILDEEGFAFDMICGVDWPDDNRIELVYDFMHFHGPGRVSVRTRLPRDNPEIPSLAPIFAGANWHERETAEFYGVRFTGHPNPVHLLLPEDFEGYPLRKDFKPVHDAP